MTHLPTLIIILVLITLLVLLTGLVVMAIGGKKNKAYSTKLMVLRIIMQASVIICLGLLYILHR